MGAVEVKKVQGEVDRSEAACVDGEYEYLLKNKDQGITFEEYCGPTVGAKYLHSINLIGNFKYF